MTIEIEWQMFGCRSEELSEHSGVPPSETQLEAVARLEAAI